MEQNENCLPLKTGINKVTACDRFRLRGPHQRRKSLGDHGSGHEVTSWSWLPGSLVVLAPTVPHPQSARGHPPQELDLDSNPDSTADWL